MLQAIFIKTEENMSYIHVKPNFVLLKILMSDATTKIFNRTVNFIPSSRPVTI